MLIVFGPVDGVTILLAVPNANGYRFFDYLAIPADRIQMNLLWLAHIEIM